jgi:hypothetical protein
LGLVWTILLNGMLGLAGYLAARHAFRQPAGLPRALAAAGLAWTWATLGMEILGPFGLYQVGSLVAWVAVGLAIALAIRAFRPAPPDLISPSTEPGLGVAAVLAIGFALWTSLVLFTPSLMLPVKVVSDGPIYHLYFAARWWKEGRLFLIASPFGENAATYFPAGGDLWFAWLTIPLGGDRLARVGQIPFLLMAATAAYAMARRLGTSVSAAAIATTWFVTSMPFHVFSFEANVDTIFIAGYLTAVYFFLRFALGDDQWPSLALGALAAGGAWGVKPTATVFVPVILGLMSLFVLVQKAPARAKVLKLALLAALPMTTAGFWFARNALLSGNPLYPLHVSAFGRVLLPGWYEGSAMRRSQFYIEFSNWRAFVDIMNTALDPRLTSVWLAALLGAWSIGVRRKHARWIWGFAALAALNIASYWILIPYRTQQRFMLQGLGLWVVPLACLFDRSPRVRVLAVCLLAVHVLTPQPWPFERQDGGSYWSLSREIPVSRYVPVNFPRTLDQIRTALTDPGAAFGVLFSIAIGVAAMSIAWSWARLANRVAEGPSRAHDGSFHASSWARPVVRRLARPWPLALGITCGVLASHAALIFSQQPSGRAFPPFRDYYVGWNELDLRTGRGGAKIAYAGTDIPYYLMGSGLKNDVRYVNINRRQGWLLHDYHKAARDRGLPTWDDPRPLWDRIERDYDAWLENLRDEGIQILVVARAKPENGPLNIADRQWFTIERVWAESHPESFTPLYGVAERDPEFRFYRVHPVFKNSGRSATDLHRRAH